MRISHTPLIASLSVVLLLILWEVIIYVSHTPSYVMPAPSAVLHTLWQERSLLLHHLSITLFASLSGMLIGISLALLMGGLLSLYPALHTWLYPHILISQMIPLIALTPVLVLWLGFGITTKIFVVTLIVFFPMLQAFLDGIKRIDPDYHLLFDTLNANKSQRFYKLLLPAACLNMLSGTKVAVTYCISAAMIAEWLGANYGIGVYIQRSMSNFKSESMFAGIFLIIISTLILLKLVFIIDKKFQEQQFNLH